MKSKRGTKAPPIRQLTDIIKLEYFQQVRFFIDLGINPDIPDDEGRTPLMLCAFMEPEVWGVGIARLLIEKGTILDCCDKYGMNVMHLASIYGRTDLARVLLHALDFDLIQQDNWGNTPLHYAVRNGALNVVKLLVHTQCKYRLCLDRKNKDGQTALNLAHRLSLRKFADVIEGASNQPEAEIEALSMPSINLGLSRENLNTRSFSDHESSSRRCIINRPKTAFVRRGSTASSSSSSTSRSSLTLADRQLVSYRNFIRSDAEPNERDNKRILRCASLAEFRNNPEYLYHLVEPGVLPGSVNRQGQRPKSAFVPRTPRSVFEHEGPYFSWRVEFKKLYKHFEYQCTSSYRDSVKYVPSELPQLDNPPTPSPSEDVGDDSDKRRNKRASSAVKPTGTPDSGKQRKQSQQHQQHQPQQQQQQQQQKQDQKRKSSSTQPSHGHGRHSTSAMEMGSSSESISSASSSKKQITSEVQNKSSAEKSGSDASYGGRQSRVSQYKNKEEITDLS